MFFGGEPPSFEPEEDAFHEENEWGIEVMPETDEGEGGGTRGSGPQGDLPDGVEFSLPVSYSLLLLLCLTESL